MASAWNRRRPALRFCRGRMRTGCSNAPTAWRAALDGIATPQPCFEWAINWLADHAPKVERFALCHRDLRLGKFAAEGEKLTGIFDLELAGWSDPMEDLGSLLRAARGAACRSAKPAASAAAKRSMTAIARSRAMRSTTAACAIWEIAAAARQGIAALRRAARRGAMWSRGWRHMLDGLQSLEAEYDLLVEIEQFSAEAT